MSPVMHGAVEKGARGTPMRGGMLSVAVDGMDRWM